MADDKKTTVAIDAPPKEWLKQAKTLSEALPYMRRYADETLVIKFGGNAMGDAALAELFARDIVLLRQVGSNPIVVHGGGPQIGAMLDKLKIKSEFINGLRVTDQETIDVVEMVLSGSINKGIVSEINAQGGFAVGLSGKDGNLIMAEKILNLGLVGAPKTITTHLLDQFETSDITPVIAPIGAGPNGETLNINADTAAGAIAGAMHAKRLLMLTDIKGVLDSNGKLIAKMTASEAQVLIDDGTVKGGMIPKVETCLNAIKDGVEAAVIIDGRIPHALLLELFTKHGAGTLIVAD